MEPGQILQDASVSVIDFGFPANDARRHGHPLSASFALHAGQAPQSAVPVKKEKTPEVECEEVSGLPKHVAHFGDEEDEDSDDGDDDDDDASSLAASARFPFLTKHIEAALNSASTSTATTSTTTSTTTTTTTTATSTTTPNTSSPTNNTISPRLALRLTKALFDFAKGADCEMDLKEKDSILLVTDLAAPAPLPAKSKSADRLASIEDLANDLPDPTTTPTPLEFNTRSHISLSPPPNELIDHLADFLHMQQEYGKGWVVAVKLHFKDVGGRALRSEDPEASLVPRPRVVHRFRMRLLDIGLVPNSYVV
ncbi:hypothetical protein HDU98_010467 [Podochytrium sp. JEL0797]|nr:hypothetical protein HDU98_010467 [Podochytrium sp. JEL0797]